MPTSLLDGGGEALGTLWGEQKAPQYLAEAGFRSVEVAQPEGDETHAYFICRASSGRDTSLGARLHNVGEG